MTSSQIPTSDPVLVAPETWLIPNLAAAGPGRYLPVSTDCTGLKTASGGGTTTAQIGYQSRWRGQ
jgi:hypothetical protein